ncbi:unnamed protein product [Linum trigynum]|uniref:Uncharacterized protein n=1 Tax=Linum trigynum TaxID=586398 RepID=A0AAV2EGP4_9ROSI
MATVNDHHLTASPSSKSTTKKTFLGLDIGAHEFYSAEMWKALATELVGSTLILLSLATAAVGCSESQHSDPKLTIPLFVFAIAFLFLYVTIPISGGFLNPTFATIAALKGVVTLTRGLCCVVAECLGALLTSVLLRLTMAHPLAHKYSLAGCVMNDAVSNSGVGQGTAFVVEFTTTFLVLFTAVTVAFDRVRAKEIGLAGVTAVIATAYALASFVGITVTGRAGYGGAGLNPARCMAAAVVYGGPLWDGLWVFWAGPILACFVYCAFSLTFAQERMVVTKEVEEPCV